jgi:putative oxidoreductase
MGTIKKILFPKRMTDNAFSLLILVARIIFGTLLLNHGIGKWMNVENASLTFPDPLGIGSTFSLSLVIFAEVFCSIGFILGALYRLCLIPMIITLAVAFFIIHSEDAFAVKELALMYLITFILLFIAGPGQFSVDAAIRNTIMK